MIESSLSDIETEKYQGEKGINVKTDRNPIELERVPQGHHALDTCPWMREGGL